MYLIVLNLAGKIAAACVAGAAPGAALALWFGPEVLVAYHMFVPRSQGLVRTHWRFATTRREVWLTIDDGPDREDTPRILDLLAAHGARATFFVIGEKALAQPEVVRSIAAAGHEVALHTHTHPLRTFWCASPQRVARELDANREVLRSIGITPTRFRPPAGIKNLWLRGALATRGLACIGWSARGLERMSANAEAVATRVTRGLAPGAILLLHEGSPLRPAIRVHAIRQVLERLQAQGYRCVVPEPGQLAD